MTIFDITTDPGPYPQPWGLLDDDAQTINDADTTTLPQARITAFKMYELLGAGATGITDDDAIHDNVAAEISAIAEKATPVSADLVVIEDSAAANAKKRVQVGNLPGGDITTDPAFDAKGDLIGGTGADTAARLAVGTDGQHLVADSGQSTGLNWEDPPTGGGGGSSASGTVTTTDATPTTAYSFGTTTDTAYQVVANFIGRRTSDSAAVGGYTRIATFRNDGGTLTRIAASSTTHTNEDTASWDVDLIASGTDIVAQVTGVAATTIDWSVDAVIVDDGGTVVGGVATDHLAIAASTPTANVNGVVGQLDLLTMSSMTANIDYLLPTTATVGQRCGVQVVDGDPDWEVLLKSGAAGDEIEGVDHSTNEWSRLFIKGERVEFVCIDAAGPHWLIDNDKRRPCRFSARLSTAADGESAATWTVPTAATTPGAWTVKSNIGGCFAAGTSRFTGRRGNDWNFVFSGAPKDAVAADSQYFGVRLADGTDSIQYDVRRTPAATTGIAAQASVSGHPISAGDTIDAEYITQPGSLGLDLSGVWGEKTVFGGNEVL